MRHCEQTVVLKRLLRLQSKMSSSTSFVSQSVNQSVTAYGLGWTTILVEDGQGEMQPVA